MMLGASVGIVLGWISAVSSFETPTGAPLLSDRTTFIGGVIGCCLTQSLHADDLKWAHVYGFTFSTDMKFWPGHPVRVTAEGVASLLPEKIKNRSRRVLRRRAYSNSEMHADLLYIFGSSVSISRPLPKWKKFLAKTGPRSWELRSLFEDVSALVENTDALDKILWEKGDVSGAIQAVDPALASIRETMAPFFDHIRSAEAVFVPFLSPRSGFGIAPQGDHIIIAFGPGLDSNDHTMTVWHELLHFPVRRVMHEVLKANRTASLERTEDLAVVEENIVAVLTDDLCPVSRDRPDMKFDSLIRKNLESARQVGGYLDLAKLVDDVITKATSRGNT